MKNILNSPLTVIVLLVLTGLIGVAVFDVPLANAILIGVSVLLGLWLGMRSRKKKSERKKV